MLDQEAPISIQFYRILLTNYHHFNRNWFALDLLIPELKLSSFEKFCDWLSIPLQSGGDLWICCLEF